MTAAILLAGRIFAPYHTGTHRTYGRSLYHSGPKLHSPTTTPVSAGSRQPTLRGYGPTPDNRARRHMSFLAHRHYYCPATVARVSRSMAGGNPSESGGCRPTGRPDASQTRSPTLWELEAKKKPSRARGPQQTNLEGYRLCSLCYPKQCIKLLRFRANTISTANIPKESNPCQLQS